MKRATFAATVVAFLLVPATPAAAEGTLKVNIAGSGSGEVKDLAIFNHTEPEIECPGVCEGVINEENPYDDIGAFADEGSEFVGWTITSGTSLVDSCEEKGLREEVLDPYQELYPGIDGICIIEPVSGVAEITAEFDTTIIVDPIGSLVVTKSPNPASGEGTGTVLSNPRGIRCGKACTEAVGFLYMHGPVELTAKPSPEDVFVEWTGACSGSSPTCTVNVEALGRINVGAVFSGPSKEILNPTPLTVDKGESYGEGTAKGPGLSCEALCNETTVLYQGPLTEPKVKPGKTVVLKQAPAFGSEFTGWSGCDSVNEEGNCVVEMSEPKTVSAEYAVLPSVSLTVEKSPYTSGAGTVLSKPRGIKCGSYCTQAIASMPEGAAVELKEKPAKENSFVKWQGGDCEGLTTEICVVTMDEAETIAAVFSGPTKTVANPQTLTLAKGEGFRSGYGTVKGPGLRCEALCTSTSVFYKGPVAVKPGKTIVLKQAPEFGSAFFGWSGCDSEDEEGNCVVTMGTAREVVAEFNELE
ncbi:MAG: InlB B-repeat-containing protein [Chloroflexota bacterium]